MRTRSRHKREQLENLGQNQNNRYHEPASHLQCTRFNFRLVEQVHVFTEFCVVPDTVLLEWSFCVVFEVSIEA